MTRATTVVLFLSLCPSFAIAQSFVEQHTERYTAGPQTEIVLQNVTGNITVLPWDEPVVQIDWVIRAYQKHTLDAAWVEIDPHGDKIEVRTAYPIAKHASFRTEERTSGPDSVDYMLHVPRKLRSLEILAHDGELRVTGLISDLRVASVNGVVEVENVSGNMDITTMHAPQVIRLGSISGRRTIRLESVNGSIRVSLSRASNVNLQVASANGGLSNEFGWRTEKKEYVPGRSLRGKLGTGEATLEIQEVNGSISAVAE